jgi:4-carboxymuconolactone decarboxylase
MVTETILEVHLFAGFPAAIEAFIALRPYFNTRTAKSSAGPPARTSHRARGVRVCRRVYGENFGKLMKNMRALNPDLARWIMEDGYGKVLGRPGLSLLHRELIAIGVLGSSGWPRQLESHIRGAMNTGGSPQMLLKTLEILRPFVKAGRKRDVDTLFSRLLKTGKIPKRA